MPTALRTSVEDVAVGASSQTLAPARARWLVLAGILLLAVNLRTAVTSVGPVLDSVQADLGMSGLMAGLVGMAPTAAFAVFAAVTPLLVRGLGLERTAWIAMAVAALGHILRSAAPESVSFLAASVVALAGMGVGNVVAPPLVKRYFGDRIGSVTAAYVLLLSLGTALPAQLAVPLESVGGWRLAVGAWSVVAVAAALPWLVVWWRGRRAARRDGPGALGAHGLTWTLLLRSPVAWGLTLMLGTTSLSTYALLTWLPTMLAEAGVGRAAAGTMLALYAGLGMPMSLLVPPLAVRLRNPFVIVAVAMAAMLTGYAGMFFAPQTLTLAWVVLLGMGAVPFPLALALINLRSSTHAGATGLSGFAQSIGYTLACAGPLVAGVLRDASGDWRPTLAFLSLILVVTTVGGFVVCRPVTVEESLVRG